MMEVWANIVWNHFGTYKSMLSGNSLTMASWCRKVYQFALDMRSVFGIFCCNVISSFVRFLKIWIILLYIFAIINQLQLDYKHKGILSFMCEYVAVSCA